MPVIAWTLGIIGCFLSAQFSLAEDSPAADPLFQDNAILQVKIVAPLRTLMRDRPVDEELPARFHFTDVNGSDVAVDIEVRARGRFRRREDVCSTPPLRLDFKKSSVKHTLFHKQDKLKLVTHCKSGDRYTQVVLREFLAYRILNILTESSYRVRLLQITYVDTDRELEDQVQYGFVIEHKDRLAKRIGSEVLEIPRTRVADLDPQFTNLGSVFQFLIGNTDFSPIKAAPGEHCCHNFALFGNEGEPILSIPYDFDQSGLVDAPYAAPSANFDLSSVKVRLYRGRCVNNAHLPGTLTLFNERRDAIEAVISELEPVSRGSRKSMLRYVNDFYKLIQSERKVESRIVKKCI